MLDANLFSEGAIYYYENNTNTKKDYKNENLNHDFLVSRPVYIIGSKDSYEDYTVNVFIITSNLDRVGIPINVTGWRSGKIIPYSTYTVHKKYLTTYMGTVSDEIKKIVRDAYKYHCGFSTEKPIYLKKEKERIKEIKNFVKGLTPKQKSIYYFLKSKCEITEKTGYVHFYELWNSYKKSKSKVKYETAGNFSKELNKVLKIFPNVHMDESEEDYSIIYYGLCLKGQIHNKTISDQVKRDSRKNVITNEKKTLTEADTKTMDTNQLLDHLSENSLKIYKKMDLIEKISNWKSNPDYIQLDIKNVSDLWIIKRLISIEIEAILEHLFRDLDKGMNPNNLSPSKKYILVRCTDQDLTDHIDKKYLKKGLNKFRKNLKNSIGYLMRQ